MMTLVRRGAAALLLVMAGAGMQVFGAAPNPGIERFYIGTYSGAIYENILNLGTSAFGTSTNVASLTDPSFLALTPDRRFLYSVSEGAGNVAAYAVNSTNGRVTFLNQLSSNGGAPCHIVVDSTGKMVFVANYNGGSLIAYPIQANGSLGAATAFIQEPGPAGTPHAHFVALDNTNHFAFLCDLGLEQIRCFIFDPVAGTLTTNTTLITSVPVGSGPRHMTFDPQFQRAYVICQNSSTVIAFNYDSTNGILAAFQTISTLPPAGFPGNQTAEIVMHPGGKFLYGSNRGYNSIVVYQVNPVDGTLTNVQQQATGTTPRNFAVDPTGKYCIVASQDSSDVRLYSINQQTGLLTYLFKAIPVANPVCILPFLQVPPQPVLTVNPTDSDTFQLNVGNTLNLLTYQLYESTSLLPGTTWNLLTNGSPGQTNFVLNNLLDQEYFKIGVLTNY